MMVETFSLLAAVLIALVTSSACHLRGHGRPLGQQDVKSEMIETISFAPSGEDFYQKYVWKAKPIIFKNSISKWPAFKNWQSVTYLRHNFGKTMFNVDYAKIYMQQEIKQKVIQLQDFLEIYRNENVTLESNISNSKMLKEVFLPPSLQCKMLYPSPENIHVVITSGNISSPLYQTEADVVRVLLSGSSTVILYDSVSTKDLYKKDFLLSARMSNVVPGKVNLDDFPEFRYLPFYVGEMEPGDMLYVPKYWWMQVTSSGEHRVGVNMFFDPFNFEDEFRANGIDSRNDIVEATDLHRNLISKQPSKIRCTDKRMSLRDVLKINQSDPKTLGLRIPKKNKRPDDVILASGFKMPVFGLGTALLYENTSRVVKYALSIGYRLFDSAQGYPGSEVGIADAIKQSTVPRSEIFIVTKLHPRYLGYNTTLAAIDDSLKRLETSYIDLFLIHSKECDDFLLKCEEGEPHGTWQETWKAMEHARKLGKIRSLGVSNFLVNDLKELLEVAEVPVSVVQNWFDPIHQDASVRSFCTENNIRYMGYSTLGGMWTQMGVEENPILTSSLLTDLSTHYDYVVSHVILRWAIHKNVTVIPGSSNENHIAQNIRSLDISLSEYDIKDVDSMGSIMNDMLNELYSEVSVEEPDAGRDAEESEGGNASRTERIGATNNRDGSENGIYAGLNAETQIDGKTSAGFDNLATVNDNTQSILTTSTNQHAEATADIRAEESTDVHAEGSADVHAEGSADYNAAKSSLHSTNADIFDGKYSSLEDNEPNAPVGARVSTRNPADESQGNTRRDEKTKTNAGRLHAGYKEKSTGKSSVNSEL